MSTPGRRAVVQSPATPLTKHHLLRRSEYLIRQTVNPGGPAARGYQELSHRPAACPFSPQPSAQPDRLHIYTSPPCAEMPLLPPTGWALGRCIFRRTRCYAAYGSPLQR